MTAGSTSRSSGRITILVAGGRRSGTAVLAGILARLGVAVPFPAPGGADATDAASGPDVLGRLHERMLAAAGSRWNDCLPLDPFWRDGPAGRAFAEEIASLVKTVLDDGRPLAVAAPHLPRVVPVWLGGLRQSGASAVAILPYRPPAEAASSLERLTGIPAAEGLLIWLRDMLDAEAATRELPRSFVAYDRLLADWRGELGRIARELGLAWPDLSIAAEARIDDYLEGRGRRDPAGDATAATGPDAGWPQTAFAAVERAAAGGADEAEGRAVLDALRAEFDAAIRAVAPVVAVADARIATVRGLEAKIGASEAATADLASRLDTAQRHERELENALLHRQRDLERMKRSVSWQVTRPFREVARVAARLRGKAASKQAQSAEKAAQRQAAELAQLRVPRSDLPAPRHLPARLVAFYLPQFHPIPENDAFWGRGFTEWTNVARAVPQFAGHYQPRLPADLGFYDLRVPEIQHAQIDLARQYGIHAFCFYFYWFAGRRLLEMPLDTFASDPGKDFPFLICWANENWTRRWDGREEDVLVAQNHSAEDDIAFIGYVARYLCNPRYVRVNGRPLLLVYRPAILPSAKETAERWRQWCRDNGIGEIHLASTQSFGLDDPEDFGFDSAIEFPPNATDVRRLRDEVRPLAPDFECKIFDMADLVARSRSYKLPPYRLYRGVCPSWDNTARKGKRAGILINESPAGYREWLANAVLDTEKRFRDPGSRLVFINAWNEWAEGAYLEPDQRFGHAWLAATRNALADAWRPFVRRRIVLVSHDAHEHGAQMLCAAIARTLATRFGFAVEIVLLGGGPLTWRFEECGRVHNLSDVDPSGREAAALAARLAGAGFKTAIVNTVVSGRFVETLARAGIRSVSLVHEMAGYIGRQKLERQAAAVARHAATVVFGAEAVRESFATVVPQIRQHADARVRAQGLYKRNALSDNRAGARRRLREALRIPETAPIVLTVGFADHRKGVDLFLDAGIRVAEASDAHFVWVGRHGEGVQPTIATRLAASAVGSRFHFVGFKEDTDLYYAGADIYALTSREDPLPTVAFEAMDVAVPVIAFADAGGIPDWLAGGAGVVVPWCDVDALAKAILDLVRDPARRAATGAAGQRVVHERLGFADYVGDLLDILGARPPRVSVVVPNYNYARHLKGRLDSILSQSFPIFELIVLDDASTDDSVAVARKTLAGWDGNVTLVVNEENSGSVFAQWRRGAALARGDYVWIAEADDVSAPDFLEALMAELAATNAAIGFTDSFQIDETGRTIGRSYAKYCDGGDKGRFHGDFTMSGRAFLRDCLGVKNTILNVSAVVWKREALQRALAATEGRIEAFKMAGDWRLYAELMLADEPVTYVARPLNGHRRHSASITGALDRRRHHDEIVAVHGFIAEALSAGVDDDITRKMRAYEAKVAAQFGLDGKAS